MTKMIIGIVGIVAGLVLLILGKMWGLLLILAGAIALMAKYTTFMHGRGEDPNQGTYNGVAGQGKQQSETVKAQHPDSGEQSADVWDKVEGK